MKPLSLLRRSEWSPYLAGTLLGLVTAASMAGFGKRISGSGCYQALSGYVGRWFTPEGVYWKYVVTTGLTWEVLLTLGMFLGALVSAVAGRQFAIRTMPDTQWKEVFGPSVAKRWLLVFIGTALIEYAAGVAGGCTAGLAVSGGAVFAPGAFLFIVGMFAGGIPIALWLYRKRGTRK